MPTTAKVSIRDVRHIHICGGKDLYCAHPRQYGLFNFGNGELALLHAHAKWDYHKEFPTHGFGDGYKSRAVILLQRSLDGGETWPQERNLVVFDETTPAEERHRFVFQENPQRQHIDLSHPDSIVIFNRTWLGDKNDAGELLITTFALRSADRGQTWEDAPTVVRGPGWRSYQDTNGYHTVGMPDGSRILAITLIPPQSVNVYGSDDNGLTWTFVSEVARSRTGQGGVSYPGLIQLPDGRVQCYMLEMDGATNAILMSESRDMYTWTPPRPIVHWGASPWRARLRSSHQPSTQPYPGDVQYRSPWPLLLRDGRIVVVFARRKAPHGMGAVLSEDQGATWSDEFILRDDASGRDIGYPVATQLDDGRILTAYYYMLEDGNPHGGSRFIAGTFFSL